MYLLRKIGTDVQGPIAIDPHPSLFLFTASDKLIVVSFYEGDTGVLGGHNPLFHASPDFPSGLISKGNTAGAEDKGHSTLVIFPIYDVPMLLLACS